MQARAGVNPEVWPVPVPLRTAACPPRGAAARTPAGCGSVPEDHHCGGAPWPSHGCRCVSSQGPGRAPHVFLRVYSVGPPVRVWSPQSGGRVRLHYLRVGSPVPPALAEGPVLSPQLGVGLREGLSALCPGPAANGRVHARTARPGSCCVAAGGEPGRCGPASGSG